MRSVDSKFYKSSAWKKCRAAYIKQCGGLCERCYAKGLIVPGYIVHHRAHLTPDTVRDPEQALSFSNLEYLCKECHNAEHFKTDAKPRYTVAPDGKIIVSEAR